MLSKTKKYGLTLLTAVLLTVVPVAAKADTKRLMGEDRYETAVQISKEGWKTAQNVILVTGDNFVDAVMAAPLSKKLNAPILLTTGDDLNIYTSVEIKRLNPSTVYIIGGQGVISQNVENGLKAMGKRITRIGGIDRYDTAAQIASKLGSFSEVALINSDSFTEALSISSIACIKGMPILPVPQDSIPNNISNVIRGKKINQTYILGGTDLISYGIESNMPNPKRLSGDNAYSRNAAIINAFKNELNFDTVYISTAQDYPDALAGSALAYQTSSPIILVDTPMDSSSRSLIKSKLLNNINVLGGYGTVSSYVESEVKNNILTVDYVGDITDTIVQNQKYSLPPSIIVTANDGSKKEASVNWNLKAVNTSKPGNYIFNGTIPGYNKVVNLKLTVTPIPVLISDITDEAEQKDNYRLPATVKAKMSDNTVTELPVTWDLGTLDNSKFGVYVFQGTVQGYNKKVKLTLTINPSVNEPTDFMKVTVEQDSRYDLPKTLKDKFPGSRSIKWNTSKVDTSKVGTSIYYGDVEGYPAKIMLMITVTPKVKSLISSNMMTSITRGSFFDLPKTVKAIMTDGSLRSVKVDWSVKSISTGSIGTKVVTGKVGQQNLPITLNINIVSDNIATLDKNLETAIRKVIGKPNGYIYYSDLESITDLDLSNCNLTNLYGLEKLKNLVNLNLSNNNLTNLWQLSNLERLETLNASGNKLTNTSGLSSLSGLTTLDLSNNQLTDISALGSLYNLTELRLNNNNISNIYYLQDLIQLESLYLSNNSISNYSYITHYYKTLNNKDFSI